MLMNERDWALGEAGDDGWDMDACLAAPSGANSVVLGCIVWYK